MNPLGDDLCCVTIPFETIPVSKACPESGRAVQKVHPVELYIYGFIGIMVVGSIFRVVLMLLHRQSRMNRSDEWKRVANEMRFSHHERDSSMPTKFPDFDRFKSAVDVRGAHFFGAEALGGHLIGDMVEGDVDGVWFCIMDYLEISSGGRSRRCRTICFLRSDRFTFQHRNRRFRPDQAHDLLKEAFEFRDLFLRTR